MMIPAIDVPQQVVAGANFAGIQTQRREASRSNKHELQVGLFSDDDKEEEEEEADGREATGRGSRHQIILGRFSQISIGKFQTLDCLRAQRLMCDSTAASGSPLAPASLAGSTETTPLELPKLLEKSVIIHRDENGFGLRVKGQSPVFVEHVHENGAAWRAGVRKLDIISKVNGAQVSCLDHKEVVLMFKVCSRFVGLTLLSAPAAEAPASAAPTATATRRATRQSADADPNSNSNSNSGGASWVEGVATGRKYLTIEPQKLQVSAPATVATTPELSRRTEGLSGRQTLAREPSKAQRELAANGASPKQQSMKLFRGLKDPSAAGAVDGSSRLLAGSLKQPSGASQTSANFGSSTSAAAAATNRQLQHINHRLSQSASSNSLPSDASKLLQRQYSHIPGIVVPNTAIAASQQRPPLASKRLEIVREFIDTEKTHTDRLRCLDELFYKPLRNGGLMSSEQLRQVFSCHRTLYKIHRQIYRILLSANYSTASNLANGGEPMIGSALLEIFEGDLRRRLERAACVFCSAQSTNAELLNKITRRDTKVGEFLAQVTSQQMIGRLGIKDLLATCFQRLTKYPLLLENLLKATPKPETLEEPNEFSPADNDNDDDDIGTFDENETGAEDIDSPTRMMMLMAGDSNQEDLEKARNSRRMLAISLEEEREFIGRALTQSRQILVRVNDAIKFAISHNRLKEIWKRTDKYPGVPLIDITKQQVVHEGLLTLRLSKRSFDVYVLLLTDYIIILTREGQDKYRLKFFTPDGKFSSSVTAAATSHNQQQSVYSPVFVIDEHLTTRDAATDENGFYLLCKRKDDSRIYEFASRSPAERMKWRDSIQWTIERQLSKNDRRPSSVSTITKSSSEISGKRELEDAELLSLAEQQANSRQLQPATGEGGNGNAIEAESGSADRTVEAGGDKDATAESPPSPARATQSREPTKIEGTISYVEDDGIVLPSKMESSWALVDQAIQMSIMDTHLKDRVAPKLPEAQISSQSK